VSIIRARQLRSAMPPMEAKLWLRLKALRSEGYHFRRQAPFRGYYLDFVCFSRRLVVELDGAQHGESDQWRHDRVRDQVIEGEGFTVLRFWNHQVRENVGGVMHNIRLALGAPV
jgi:very-short-patch-repair endonuclease